MWVLGAFSFEGMQEESFERQVVNSFLTSDLLRLTYQAVKHSGCWIQNSTGLAYTGLFIKFETSRRLTCKLLAEIYCCTLLN
jgi:hypothetical protein